MTNDETWRKFSKLINCRASSQQERTERDFLDCIHLSEGKSFPYRLPLTWMANAWTFIRLVCWSPALQDSLYFAVAFFIKETCLSVHERIQQLLTHPLTWVVLQFMCLLQWVGWKGGQWSKGRGKWLRFLHVKFSIWKWIAMLDGLWSDLFSTVGYRANTKKLSIFFSCWAKQDSALYGYGWLLVLVHNILDPPVITELRTQDFGDLEKVMETTVQMVAHLHWLWEKSSLAPPSHKHHIWIEVLLLSVGFPGSVWAESTLWRWRCR